jgi:hypothetical protein
MTVRSPLLLTPTSSHLAALELNNVPLEQQCERSLEVLAHVRNVGDSPSIWCVRAERYFLEIQLVRLLFIVFGPWGNWWCTKSTRCPKSTRGATKWPSTEAATAEATATTTER